MATAWYVSPEGNDAGTGSATEPFATLHRALDEVRRHRLTDRECGECEALRVVLQPGVHRLETPLHLTGEDGGNGEGALTWEAESPGTATISGGFPLTDWKKLDEAPDGLPEQAQGSVWYHELPEDADVNTVYGPAGLVPRARGDAVIPLNDPHDRHRDRFTFEAGAIPEYPDITEAEAVIIPQHQWTMNVLPIAGVDTERNELHLAEQCTYPIGVPHCAPDGSIWIENSLGVISPGTWVFHKADSRLYYWPEDGRPAADLAAPLLTEFVRVEGEGAGERAAVGVTFRGIVFTHSRRFPFHGRTGRGVQHDWEMFDAPSCMVRFRHAEKCRVEGCTFIHGGSGGIRLDLASRGNAVVDSTFHHLGGCGVVLCGYGPGRRYLNRDNLVRGNTLHHLGGMYWHSPGIFIWQSGANTVSDNHLYELPYTGIVCSGRIVFDRNGVEECSQTIDWEAVESQCGKGYCRPPWYWGGITDWSMREPLLHSRENRIEYNRIHDVMKIMGDGNGIYISGAGGGNVVRFNAIGPCPSPTMAEGIRCDDDQHQTIIHGNLVFGQGGMATGITLKGVNRITNNILALPCVDACRRGMLSLETGPLNGSVVRRNVFLTRTPAQTFVGQIRIHGTGRTALLRDTDSDCNVYFCTESPELGEGFVEEMRGFGADNASLGCDPGFVDAEQGDYSLRADSPLHGLGFRPLPLQRMFAAGARG